MRRIANHPAPAFGDLAHGIQRAPPDRIYRPPLGRGITPVADRSSNRAPNCASSAAICALNAGCVRPNRAAACRSDPVSMAAASAAICRRLGETG